MDDEQRDEVLRQAFETLERTKPISDDLQHRLENPPIGEDPLTKWRREKSERADELARERDHRDFERLEARVTANVLASMQVRIDAAVSSARQEMAEGENVTAKAFEDLDRLFGEVDTKLATIAAKLAVVELLLKRAPTDAVLDLPALPLRGAGKPLNS
jgi:hypothetical protein